MASMVKVGGRWVNAEQVTHLVQDNRSWTQIHFVGGGSVKVPQTAEDVANALNMTGTVDQVLAFVFKMMVREGLVGVSMENIVVQQGTLPTTDTIRAVVTQALEAEVH